MPAAFGSLFGDGGETSSIPHLRAVVATAVGDLILAYNEATDETGGYVVTDTISHVDQTVVLLTDNGSSFLHANFEAYLKRAGMDHIRTAPHHPMTQGKIERFHLSSKNRLLLNIYATPERLELAIGEWIEHYNHSRYHEALHNVTPADVYYGRQPQILSQRQQLKLATIARRKALVTAPIAE